MVLNEFGVTIERAQLGSGFSTIGGLQPNVAGTSMVQLDMAGDGRASTGMASEDETRMVEINAPEPGTEQAPVGAYPGGPGALPRA